MIVVVSLTDIKLPTIRFRHHAVCGAAGGNEHNPLDGRFLRGYFENVQGGLDNPGDDGVRVAAEGQVRCLVSIIRNFSRQGRDMNSYQVNNTIHTLHDLLKSRPITKSLCKNSLKDILPILLLEELVQPWLRVAHGAPHHISFFEELVHHMRTDVAVCTSD